MSSKKSIDEVVIGLGAFVTSLWDVAYMLKHGNATEKGKAHARAVNMGKIVGQFADYILDCPESLQIYSQDAKHELSTKKLTYYVNTLQLSPSRLKHRELDVIIAELENLSGQLQEKIGESLSADTFERTY